MKEQKKMSKGCEGEILGLLSYCTVISSLFPVSWHDAIWLSFRFISRLISYNTSLPLAINHKSQRCSLLTLLFVITSIRKYVAQMGSSLAQFSIHSRKIKWCASFFLLWTTLLHNRFGNNRLPAFSVSMVPSL